MAQVCEHRTKQDYAPFMHALVARYPKAQKIRLVQDTFTTPTVSAFSETFPAAAAFALAQRFEFPYTPKRASWLHRIEIEFSAFSQQCVARCFATKDQVEQAVLLLVNER